MSEYKKLKQQLKDEQLRGEAPEWVHTNGYQILRQKGYLSPDETPRQRFEFIAKHLSQYVPEQHREKARDKFFELMWSGKYSHSTPAYSNIGRPYKGMPISCSGGWVDDSIDGFYTANHEIAMLSKNGFGTSAYLGDIRPRGTKISGGGEAEGIIPVMDTFFDTASKVSQTGSRRGAVACYFDIDHPDAKEAFQYVEKNQKGVNIGVNITDAYIARYNSKEPEANALFQELCFSRCIGKGYMHFVDRANRALPDCFKRKGLEIKGSNLCSEVELPSNDYYSFTCCLGSLNLIHWDTFTDEDIMYSLLMLDCVNSDFIANCPPALYKVKRFAEDFRAIGLGVMALATYFQQKGIVFDSLEAKFKNTEIFKRISEVGKKANLWMGEMLGVPEALKEEGWRNATQFAVAPTLSTAVIMGGVSQGIEPIFANAYIHESPAGDLRRASPWLMNLLKEKGKWSKEVIDTIIDREGSIQHLDFLTDEEKALGKTAFEMDQFALARMADDRAPYIDQGQSYNSYFNALATEQEIGDYHRYIFNMTKNLKACYYIRSMSMENSKIKHLTTACEACAS